MLKLLHSWNPTGYLPPVNAYILRETLISQIRVCMIVFLRPHLSSVASGATTGAGLLYSLTLKLNCLWLTTCLFITVLIKNYSGNVELLLERKILRWNKCCRCFIVCRMSKISQIKFNSDFKWRPDASRNELCLKEMTNFTKVGVFLGRHAELVITACPTYYFPPLSTEKPISAPRPQPQARHSG